MNYSIISYRYQVLAKFQSFKVSFRSLQKFKISKVSRLQLSKLQNFIISEFRSSKCQSFRTKKNQNFEMLNCKIFKMIQHYRNVGTHDSYIFKIVAHQSCNKILFKYLELSLALFTMFLPQIRGTRSQIWSKFVISQK